MGAGRVATALLPYALAAVAVVVASAIALAGSVRAPAVTRGLPIATPVASAGPRVAGLSDARMAYWRAAASGSLELWVSDLDGGRRWTIATASADADLALTRWSPDGSAIAYRTGNGTIGIARLDGSIASLVMPIELRRAAWRIVSYEWSPDAKRIAATFRAGGGLGNESDIYVAEIAANATWQRVTTLGDAFAEPWIDRDRLFVGSASGLIAVLDLRTKELRPVTGLPAASPLIGRDGRVYFSGGLTVGADVMAQPVGAGWVWSATIDGEELRRETAAEHGQARLFGVLADERAVIGVPGGVYLASDTLLPLVFAGAGAVRRVIVSEDGKRLVGITENRILRIDPARIPRSLPLGALPPAAAATTLLSGIREPDVWTASKGATAVAAGGAVAANGPKERLAFVLGHALWEMRPDGRATALTSERGTLLGRPGWSPSGDRVSVLFIPVGERDPSALVVSASGAQRWRLPAASGGMTWSPDGKTLTFWIPTGTRLDRWNTHAFDPATGRAGETIPGRVTWGGGGRLVLSDGEFEITTGTAATTGLRVGQTVELITGSARRTITDARKLAASPLLKGVPDAARIALITQVVPSADPEHILVTLSRLGATQAGLARTPAFVVVRVSDGEPIHVSPIAIENGPSDLAWSPVGHLIGWGVSETTADGTVLRRAQVTDPTTGRTILRVPGRFAGWSADAAWVYVAREAGLFAYRIDAAETPVRVSPFGVIVSAVR